ncbi:MAG: ADP-ribosylglycohydrolase family protein [Planctomycetes bacterium]|nr:ADP-ribosylglycohydrolase family protein [Planctomycetota bacterium]
MSKRSITGSILGTAVGDALGLPYEGLSRRRAKRVFGQPDRHRFVLGHGMVSDDTEHTCIVAQALIASGADADAFSQQLARRLRLWLLSLPAGIGLATLKSTLRLCVGVSPQRSGVFSAGNGPAMRSAIIGAALNNPALLKQFVRSSTRITHTDPKAEYGALAVALAARLASGPSAVGIPQYVGELRKLLDDEPADEFFELVDRVAESLACGESTDTFAASLGLERGVTGYVYHTVPVALHAWLKNQHDFRSAVTDVIRCGGDTDTTAAIVGGIVGCAVGKEGIPSEWLTRLCEWPRTVTWMEDLAGRLFETRINDVTARPPRLPVYGIVPRNLAFMAIVLVHAFRRLLPPY